METDDEFFEITSSASDFSSLREALENNGLTFVEAEIQMVPSTYVNLDENGARRMDLLLEKLDELDDVIEVFHNWEQE